MVSPKRLSHDLSRWNSRIIMTSADTGISDVFGSVISFQTSSNDSLLAINVDFACWREMEAFRSDLACRCHHQQHREHPHSSPGFIARASSLSNVCIGLFFSVRIIFALFLLLVLRILENYSTPIVVWSVVMMSSRCRYSWVCCCVLDISRSAWHLIQFRHILFHVGSTEWNIRWNKKRVPACYPRNSTIVVFSY